MSALQYRRDLDRKRAQRADALKKAGALRVKEADKKGAAAKARASAARSSSVLTIKSKLSEAQRRENASTCIDTPERYLHWAGASFAGRSKVPGSDHTLTR
jgi:hypothetical protein